MGRYLNAARIEPEQLERLWTNRRDDSWLTNSCEPCEFREHCHRTFGVSAEGYGLYPFDGVALDHFVRVLSPDRFDPRRLVAGLAHRFLQQAARELERNEFPSGDLLSPFNDSDRGAPVLDPLELAELRAKHPNHAERLGGLLRYWSGEEWSRTAVLEAFDLPSVARTGTAPTKPAPDRVERGGGEELGPQTRLKPADRRVFDALTTWASDGADLNSAATNTLRKLIHSLVGEWLQAGPDPLNLGSAFDRDRFDQERHVSFEGSVSQQFRDSSIIRVAQTPENASALQALLLLDRGAVQSFEEFDHGGTYLQLVGSRIEEWVALVRASLAGPVSAESVERVRLLVVLARLLGCDQDARRPEDLLSAVFQLRHYVDVLPTGRSAKWQALVTEAQRLRPSLMTALEVEFGEARGRSGGIRAVRGDQLLSIIEDFATSWDLRPQSAEFAQLSRLLSAAVDAEWGEIQAAVDRIDRLLDAERPLPDQLGKCLEALGKAFELGRLADDGLLRQLRQLVNEVPEDADRILRDVRSLLQRNPPLDVRLRCCAGPAPVALALVSRVFNSLDDLLSSVERDVAVRQRQVGEALDATDVMARVLASSSELAAECRGVAP
jgi:hypothetical protein